MARTPSPSVWLIGAALVAAGLLQLPPSSPPKIADLHAPVTEPARASFLTAMLR